MSEEKKPRMLGFSAQHVTYLRQTADARRYSAKTLLTLNRSLLRLTRSLLRLYAGPLSHLLLYCIYTCMYIFIYTGPLSHLLLYTHTHTHTYTCTYIYTYTYVCVCVCVCVYIYRAVGPLALTLGPLAPRYIA